MQPYDASYAVTVIVGAPLSLMLTGTSTTASTVLDVPIEVNTASATIVFPVALSMTFKLKFLSDPSLSLFCVIDSNVVSSP